MKASLKFREDQKPLVRAKIPISILGLPFLSGISAGDSKELRLDLLTAFEAGPALRASYRPNDSSNPFTFSIKTGVGRLGSPAAAPMSMTAEFSLLSGNPRFTVLFKPNLGDFSLKKSVASSSPAPWAATPAEKKVAEVDADGSAVWVETPNGGLGKVVPAGGLGAMLGGIEVSARSVMPLRSRTAVKFKWGVRIPSELRTALSEEGSRRAAASSFGKMPVLVMSKISIEHIHVVDDDKVGSKGKEGDEVGRAAADVAEVCMGVRRQLEAIQADNGALRRVVEELKGTGTAGDGGGGTSLASAREAEVGKSGGGARREGRNLDSSGRAVGAGPGVPKKDEMTEELKKALNGAAGGGGN